MSHFELGRPDLRIGRLHPEFGLLSPVFGSPNSGFGQAINDRLDRASKY